MSVVAPCCGGSPGAVLGVLRPSPGQMAQALGDVLLSAVAM